MQLEYCVVKEILCFNLRFALLAADMYLVDLRCELPLLSVKLFIEVLVGNPNPFLGS
jgi:hypothetical protein